MPRPQRRSGLLLHPTSLPSPGGIGTLGQAAHDLLRFLHDSYQRAWQLLPLGPASGGNSPYSATSAFAGNPLLLDLPWIASKGWLDHLGALPPDSERVDYDAVAAHKLPLLRQAFDLFQARASQQDRDDLAAFCAREAAWLDDFALFSALSDAHQRACWTDWPRPLRLRDPDALAQARDQHARALAQTRFEQYLFDRQWSELRARARELHIELIGDIPIFVSLDCADVWVNRHLFLLDDDGQPTAVAGVPPDYFSATGQRWGNPLYDWPALQAQGYRWWIDRFAAALKLFDTVRVDHFRGFAAYWEIPADAPTAMEGRWVPGPGRALFDAVRAALGNLPLIAEDLGDITPDVEQLRDELGLPGMKILQFGFGNLPTDPHLPHNHPQNAAVYTGTHDNNTAVGWYWSTTQEARDHLWRYARLDGEDLAARLVTMAWASPADLAVTPAQDLLGLGPEARMNLPGEPDGNWSWRMRPHALTAHHAQRLRDLTFLYGRTPPPPPDPSKLAYTTPLAP
jgi:4-alpha-glucanotransferase